MEIFRNFIPKFLLCLFLFVLSCTDVFSLGTAEYFECKTKLIYGCISQYEKAIGYKLIIPNQLEDVIVDFEVENVDIIAILESMFRSAGFKNIGVLVDKESMVMSVTVFGEDGLFDKKVNKQVDGSIDIKNFGRDDRSALNKSDDTAFSSYEDVSRSAAIDLDGYIELPSGQVITFREMESVQQKAALRSNQNDVLIVNNNDSRAGITLRHVVETAQRANELIKK